jgi:methyl-accepting chemotaxis protein
MKIKNLNIGVRLGMAFGVLLLLIAAVAYTGWSALAATKARMDVVTNENAVKIKVANDMQDGLNLLARALRDYLLYSDKDYLQAQRGRIETARRETEDGIGQMAALVRSDKARQLLDEIRAHRSEAYVRADRMLALADGGKADEAKAFLRNAVQAEQDQWFAALDAMIALQEAQNKAAVEEMDRDYHLSVRIIAAVVAAALLSGLLLAYFIARSIVQPLLRAVSIAQAVAGGDLTSRIEAEAADETGLLTRALGEMNEALKRIVGQVRSGADAMASASTQIASGNLELSARTEQQASSLEETASSMEQMTATVKQNADNARQANQLAASASEVARKGGSVVTQVVATMGDINDASRKIVEIIAVIDGIAFQTNILALNAAVEAARAGEQGRGFAVVAGEVRNLAQRAAAAAHEIKALIGQSVDKVEHGSKLVGQAGSTMDEIVASVQRVTDIMGEISSASREQEAGIEQINQAVGDMDTVTQQNAALVEEAAAAAASLQDQSAGLVQLVSVFKLDAADRPGSAATAGVLRLARKGAPAAAGVAVLERIAHGARKSEQLRRY